MKVASWVPSASLLAGLAARAPIYDVENRFCAEDLVALRGAGYLRIGVPSSWPGGVGLGLAATASVQRTIAAAAPATALGLGMHQVWVQAARIVARRGHDFLDLVFEHAAADQLLAFGVSEPGNDRVLFDSKTTAEPDGAGGFRFTGRKTFTSLAPAWDVLSVFGKDSTGAEARLIHGFAVRSDAGVSHPDDWDTLGMRATQSRSTVLDGVYIPRERIVRSVPVGPSPDPLTFAVFAAFELLVASVYVGIAERAIAIAIAAATERVDMDGRPRSSDPDTRRGIAEARSSADAVALQVGALASDVDAGTDHGARWFALLAGVKARAVAAAEDVVGTALRLVGGASFRASAELARLSRDVRAGQFHPSSLDSALRTIAAADLGPLPA